MAEISKGRVGSSRSSSSRNAEGVPSLEVDNCDTCVSSREKLTSVSWVPAGVSGDVASTVSVDKPLSKALLAGSARGRYMELPGFRSRPSLVI